MARREVITLQVGSFANYVGAHYWNLQDEAAGLAEAGGSQGDAYRQLCAPTLYRESSGVKARLSEKAAARTHAPRPQGVPAFTPRLLLFDVAGATGGVALGGAREVEPVTTWSGETVTVRADPVRKSHFYTLLEKEARGEEEEEEEEAEAAEAAPAPAPAAERPPPRTLRAAAAALEDGGVQYWTDYLKAELHPRSAALLPPSLHGGASFGDSAGAARGAAFQEAVEEQLRFFAEECDSLSGFQLLAEDCGGLGAVAEALLLRCADSYPRLPTLLYSTRPAAEGAEAEAEEEEEGPMGSSAEGAARRCRHARALSTAWAEAAVAPLCSLYVPLSAAAGGGGWRARLGGQAWRAAAPLACAVDALGTPWRLGAAAAADCGDAVGIAEAVGALGATGRPMACASLLLPLPPLRAEAAPAAAGKGAPPTPVLDLSGLEDLTRGTFAAAEKGRGRRPAPHPLPRPPLSEAVCLRGVRDFGGGAAAPLPRALQAAHLALPRQPAPRSLLCATLAPLPLPLPFPRLLEGRAGEAAAAARAWAAPELAEALAARAGQLRRCAATAAGRAMLAGWGAAAEAEGQCEALLSMAGEYRVGEASSDEDE